MYQVLRTEAVFFGGGGWRGSWQSQCGWITDKKFKIVWDETGEQARRSQDMHNLLNTPEVLVFILVQWKVTEGFLWCDIIRYACLKSSSDSIIIETGQKYSLWLGTRRRACRENSSWNGHKGAIQELHSRKQAAAEGTELPHTSPDQRARLLRCPWLDQHWLLMSKVSLRSEGLSLQLWIR